MLHLSENLARVYNKIINVLFIDWEAQFSSTINHCEIIRAECADVINDFYWVALPLSPPNSLTQYMPVWQYWQPGIPWVRQPPKDASRDPAFFPFYQNSMSFEDFVSAFAEWFSQKRPVAIAVGIRTDESYKRFLAIASQKNDVLRMITPGPVSLREDMPSMYTPFMTGKLQISGRGSHTVSVSITLYITLCISLVFHYTLRNMRICEPFGAEQR